MDHTFKTSANIGIWENGVWKTLFDSVFLIMNEKKLVLSWVFTKSTGFIHVRHALLKVNLRISTMGIPLSCLIVDNCCN